MRGVLTLFASVLVAPVEALPLLPTLPCPAALLPQPLQRLGCKGEAVPCPVLPRPRQRQRVYPKCTWLTTPKSTWPRYAKPGERCRGLRRLVLGTAGFLCWCGYVTERSTAVLGDTSVLAQTPPHTQLRVFLTMFQCNFFLPHLPVQTIPYQAIKFTFKM